MIYVITFQRNTNNGEIPLRIIPTNYNRLLASEWTDKQTQMYTDYIVFMLRSAGGSAP